MCCPGTFRQPPEGRSRVVGPGLSCTYREWARQGLNLRLLPCQISCRLGGCPQPMGLTGNDQRKVWLVGGPTPPSVPARTQRVAGKLLGPTRQAQWLIRPLRPRHQALLVRSHSTASQSAMACLADSCSSLLRGSMAYADARARSADAVPVDVHLLEARPRRRFMARLNQGGIPPPLCQVSSPCHSGPRTQLLVTRVGHVCPRPSKPTDVATATAATCWLYI
jgi:hypothetical protein